MANHLIRSIAFGSLLMAAACGGEQPLLFVSTENYGIGIAISGTSTNPVDLNLGYKGVDASFVPVSVVGQAGDYHAVRGCYNTVIGAGQTTGCSAESENRGQPVPVRARPTSLGFEDTDGPRILRIQAPMAPLPTRPADPALALPLPPPTSVPTRPTPIEVQAPAVPPGRAPGIGGKDQAQSMIDSLSVFSSFNATGKGSTTAGVDVGLGKVFATGVAAQQLTEGQNYFLQYKGQSLIYAVAQCLENLTKAMGAAKAQAADVQVCNPK